MSQLTGGVGYEALTAFSGELSSILKEYYLPGIHSQLENAKVLLKYLQRNTEEISGRYAVIPLIIGRNWGVGYRTDRQQEPKAGFQKSIRAQVPMASLFGTIQVTLGAIEASRDSVGSYQSAIEYESRLASEDLPKLVNERLFGDGTGRLSQVNGVPAGAVITVDAAALANSFDAKDATRYVHEGMPLDSVSSTTGLVTKSGMTVASVDRSAGTVTVDDATGVGDNDYLVLGSFNGSGNEYNAVTSGLANVVASTGTFQGLARASYPRWQSNLFAASGNVLTLDLMQQACDATQFVGGGMVQLILTSPEVRRKYLRMLIADKRYSNTLKLDGGFTALQYDEIPVVADPDCQTGRMYFLDLTTLAIYEYGQLGLFNLDGLTFRKVPNYPAVDALYYWYHVLGARNTIRQSLITGIDPTK